MCAMGDEVLGDKIALSDRVGATCVCIGPRRLMGSRWRRFASSAALQPASATAADSALPLRELRVLPPVLPGLSYFIPTTRWPP